MYIYLSIYIYIYISIYIYTSIHTYIHTYIYIYTFSDCPYLGLKNRGRAALKLHCCGETPSLS